MTAFLIRNVRLIGHDEPRLGNILVRNGQIESVLDENVCPTATFDAEIDGHGHVLIPGMIDVHIHGADGYDMMDGTVLSVEAVSNACARTGCTSFLATSVS